MRLLRFPSSARAIGRGGASLRGRHAPVLIEGVPIRSPPRASLIAPTKDAGDFRAPTNQPGLSTHRKAGLLEMSAILRAVALLVCLSILLAVGPYDPVDAQAGPVEECQSGLNSESSPPPPGSGSDESLKCDAPPPEQSLPPAEDSDLGGFQAAAFNPSPTGKFNVGISSTFGATAIAGTLQVQDPRLRDGTDNYFTQRLRAVGCGTGRYVEVGWAEAAWNGPDQVVYVFDSQSSSWKFYPQYVLAPGQQLYVQVIKLSNEWWSTEIWWNDQWNRLWGANLSASQTCSNEAQAEINTRSVYGQINFPAVQFGNGDPNYYYGLGLKDAASGVDRVWNTTIPTTQVDNDGSTFYQLNMLNQYFRFRAQSNQPPAMNSSVSPRTGTVSTSFCTTISLNDPDGDQTVGEVGYWGDGYSDGGAQACHTYSAPGDYEIELQGWDLRNNLTTQVHHIRVCRVKLEDECEPRTPPTNPNQGSLTEYGEETVEDSAAGPAARDIEEAVVSAGTALGLQQVEDLTADQLDAVMKLADDTLLSPFQEAAGDQVLQLLAATDYSDVLEDMNMWETAVCLGHWFDCIRARNAWSDAVDASKRRYPHLGCCENKKDAMRHCVWSALMTKRANNTFAREMGLAHEKSDRGPRKIRFDIYNNARGRAVGRAGENKSDRWIKDTCHSMAENGTLVVNINDSRLD